MSYTLLYKINVILIIYTNIYTRTIIYIFIFIINMI